MSITDTHNGIKYLFDKLKEVITTILTKKVSKQIRMDTYPASPSESGNNMYKPNEQRTGSKKYNWRVLCVDADMFCKKE
ncbi:MAG: hypothetical protein ACYDEC_13640 [Bacteroidia bacterium]